LRGIELITAHGHDHCVCVADSADIGDDTAGGMPLGFVLVEHDTIGAAWF
jgi:hypothetical protein